MENFKGLEEQTSDFTTDTVEIESGMLQELLQASRKAIEFNVSLQFDESPEGNSSVTIKPTKEGSRLNDFLSTVGEHN